MAIPSPRDPEVTRATLAKWFAERLGVGEVAVSDVVVPSQGFSNETVYFRASWAYDGERHDEELVARIQPEGHQLFLDADVLLQWRMMEAAARTGRVPVPPLLFVEPDRSVLGQPFFVMARVEGRVPPDLPPHHVSGWLVDDLTPARRGLLYENGLDILARIHELDWRDGFDFLDSPARGATGLEQYVSWVEAWYRWAKRDRPHPVNDVALEYVRANRPRDVEVTVNWGDARVGNMIFAEDLSVAAVLDWEMASLGPGEVDLGWWLFMERFWSEGFGVPMLEGIPDREETIARYEALRGRPVREIEYYEVLGGLRMATVIIRAADKQVEYENLKPDTTLGTNNQATQILARLLDLPVPDLSPELGKAMEAAQTGARH